MGVTDEERGKALRLILQDIASTGLPDSVAAFAVERCEQLLEFVSTGDELRTRLVNDVQQHVHDEFVDVSWPACSLHGKHPLWYSDGSWRCMQQDAEVAALGALSQRPGN